MLYGMVNGHFQFATYPDSGWRPRDGITAGVLPVAHALRCLDDRLDAEHPHSDNIVERRITPALMRIDPDSQSILDLAAGLGGSAYETFLTRHNWRFRPARDDYSNNTIRLDVDVTENQWFYRRVTDDSPAGARFRAENTDRILGLAERLIGSTTSGIRRGYWDRDLEFLFLDTQGQSLALTFWPRFKTLAGVDAEPYEKVTVLWAYLARAYPDSTPDMFVDAYRDCAGKQRLQNSTFTPLDLLPAGGKFAVLDSLLAETDRRLEQEDPVAIRKGRSIYKMDHDELYMRTLLLPCEPAAKRLVTYIATPENTRRRQTIADWIANARIHVAVVEGLAASGDPELRVLAVQAALKDPRPAYREVFSRLEADPAQPVREAVKRLKATHDTWLSQPLPRSGRQLRSQ